MRSPVVSITGKFLKLGFIAVSFCLTSCLGFPAPAQTTPELKDVQNQFIPEEGCPVRIVKAETRLEVDSFGAPIACRIYIDYTNSAERPVSAVKFRIGYADSEGKVRGMFHAPDGSVVSPGGQSSAKWRGEKVDPRTRLVKIRVLAARFTDGSIWESQKMEDIVKPPADNDNAEAASERGVPGAERGPASEGL